MEDQELRQAFPDITWDMPIMLSVIGDETQHYGCRLCIARNGLSAQRIPELPTTLEGFVEHWVKVHDL